LDGAGNELWASQLSKIGFPKLANDLRSLKSHFKSREISDALESAIPTADKGNGGKTLKYVAKVGHWILDTAHQD
jgi:hypothetical protein